MPISKNKIYFYEDSMYMHRKIKMIIKKVLFDLLYNSQSFQCKKMYLLENKTNNVLDNILKSELKNDKNFMKNK